MRFVGLVSGGKDSIYSIQECLRHGHELVGCVHLGRPRDETEESYMYQTAGSECVRIMVEECLKVPFLYYERQGKSVNTSLVYDEATLNDEVEDLYQAIVKARGEFPTHFDALSSGAILSTYQRTRIENVCSRLQLTSLSYLWRKATQHELLREMIGNEIHAVLVRVAAPPGLTGHKHLGKSISELESHFHRLFDKYQFHVCGEGGEYETIVLDAPIFHRRLVFDETRIEQEDGGMAANLRIIKCHSESKEMKVEGVVESCPQDIPSLSFHREGRTELVGLPNIRTLARVSFGRGGLLHISETVSIRASENPNEAEAVVEEAVEILEKVQRTLRHYGCTPQDVIMVHLYLSEISHFQLINEYYSNLFGVILPPSRSCVALGPMKGGRRVAMDCMAVRGSGSYLRGTEACRYSEAALAIPTPKLRRVLHVQSISTWAPVCVGPYSQVNTLKDSLHFVAGQIGLVPESMTLKSTVEEQFVQSCTNLARILDALDGGSLQNIMSGLVYISLPYTSQQTLQFLSETFYELVRSNANVVSGAVDNLFSLDKLNGYEDEETMRELELPETENDFGIPLVVVGISQMPVKALVEVEAIASTHLATKYLGIGRSQKIYKHKLFEEPVTVGWDSGHDFGNDNPATGLIDIRSFRSSLGDDLASFVVVDGSMELNEIGLDLNVEDIVRGMIETLFCNRLSGNEGSESLKNVRVYFLSSIFEESTLNSCIHQGFATHGVFPSFTFVPVNFIAVLERTNKDRKGNTPSSFLSFHISTMDLVKLETEFWIKSGR